MALVSTIPAVKAALLAELRALSVASDVAARPAGVQFTYAEPELDQRRSECVYFDDSISTEGEAEQRLSAGRRRRMHTWVTDLVVDSEIIADAEKAEARAFAIAGFVDDFLADNAQPHEWPTAPVSGASLSVVVTGFEVEHEAGAEGQLRVVVRVSIEIKEWLT